MFLLSTHDSVANRMRELEAINRLAGVVLRDMKNFPLRAGLIVASQDQLFYDIHRLAQEALIADDPTVISRLQQCIQKLYNYGRQSYFPFKV